MELFCREHIADTSFYFAFKGTVRDNLRMGRSEASDEEMYAALEKVNLLGFVQAAQGLDTKVAEKGGNFSGGQCQRLALSVHFCMMRPFCCWMSPPAIWTR